VRDVRKSLSEACSNFYKKKPSHIVAVTGTNGKTSVANFFFQLFKLNKILSLWAKCINNFVSKNVTYVVKNSQFYSTLRVLLINNDEEEI